MAAFQQLDIFTQAMTAEFAKAYREDIQLGAIDKALWRMPSGGRIENHLWLRLPPFFSQLVAGRQFGKPGTKKYAVENKTYSAAYEIPMEDIEDAQVGDGFKMMAAQLAENAKAHESIVVQQHLALGQTELCFDGSYFFASSHNLGTGNNIVSVTPASGDAVTHAMVVLLTGRKKLKPLIWQNRMAANLRTDSGDNLSDLHRTVKWWATMRGAPAFGLWQDAILVKFAHTPTVAEVQTALGTVNARFRSFLYPKNLSSDPDVAIHTTLEFNPSNALVLASTGLEYVVRQALTLSLVSGTENWLKGWADLAASYYLNNVT